MDYTGHQGVGAGGIALVDGRIAGLDIAGGQYVGAFDESPDGELSGYIDLSMPYGGVLVTGVPFPAGAPPQKIEFKTSAEGLEGRILTLQLPSGPVNVRLTKISDL